MALPARIIGKVSLSSRRPNQPVEQIQKLIFTSNIGINHMTNKPVMGKRPRARRSNPQHPYAVNLRVNKTLFDWLNSPHQVDNISDIIRDLIAAEMAKQGGDL